MGSPRGRPAACPAPGARGKPSGDQHIEAERVRSKPAGCASGGCRRSSSHGAVWAGRPARMIERAGFSLLASPDAVGAPVRRADRPDTPVRLLLHSAAALVAWSGPLQIGQTNRLSSRVSMVDQVVQPMSRCNASRFVSAEPLAAKVLAPQPRLASCPSRRLELHGIFLRHDHIRPHRRAMQRAYSK